MTVSDSEQLQTLDMEINRLRGRLAELDRERTDVMEALSQLARSNTDGRKSCVRQPLPISSLTRRLPSAPHCLQSWRSFDAYFMDVRMSMLCVGRV